MKGKTSVTEEGRDPPTTGSLSTRPQWPGAGQAKTRSQQFQTGHPDGKEEALESSVVFPLH